jgi:hypothetical protein
MEGSETLPPNPDVQDLRHPGKAAKGLNKRGVFTETNKKRGKAP